MLLFEHSLYIAKYFSHNFVLWYIYSMHELLIADCLRSQLFVIDL